MTFNDLRASTPEASSMPCGSESTDSDHINASVMSWIMSQSLAADGQNQMNSDVSSPVACGNQFTCQSSYGNERSWDCHPPLLPGSCPPPVEPVTHPQPVEPVSCPEPVEPQTSPLPIEPVTSPLPIEPPTSPPPIEPVTYPQPVQPPTSPPPIEPVTYPQPVQPPTVPSQPEQPPSTVPTSENPTPVSAPLPPAQYQESGTFPKDYWADRYPNGNEPDWDTTYGGTSTASPLDNSSSIHYSETYSINPESYNATRTQGFYNQYTWKQYNSSNSSFGGSVPFQLPQAVLQYAAKHAE